MNISNLFSFSTLGSRNPQRGVAQPLSEISPLAQAVQRADLRVQSEVSTNMAQMSAFGQLKSSVSQVQLAGRALAELGSNSTTLDSQTALSGLLSALNSAITRATATAALPGAPDAAQSATRVARNLKDIGSNAQATQIVSFSQSEGVFTFDSEKFRQSMTIDSTGMNAALVKLGQAIDTMAATELDSRGDVTHSLDLLKRHANTLQAQQSALQSATQATSAYNNSRSGSAGYGIGAYQSNIG
jgi:hypothetical protein